MPNYNYNSLSIEATTKKLVDDGWIIPIYNEVDDSTLYTFNLHKIFPEQYPEEY
jgi:hypothetical protein